MCKGSGIELININLVISIKNTMGNMTHKLMTMGDSFSGLDAGRSWVPVPFSGIDMVSLTGLFDVPGDVVSRDSSVKRPVALSI